MKHYGPCVHGCSSMNCERNSHNALCTDLQTRKSAESNDENILAYRPYFHSLSAIEQYDVSTWGWFQATWGSVLLMMLMFPNHTAICSRAEKHNISQAPIFMVSLLKTSWFDNLYGGRLHLFFWCHIHLVMAGAKFLCWHFHHPWINLLVYQVMLTLYGSHQYASHN